MLKIVATDYTESILLAWHTFSTWPLTYLTFLGNRLSMKGYTFALNLTTCCMSSKILPSLLVWWQTGARVALRMLPPYEPTTNTFLFEKDWPIVKPDTGMTTFSFFLSMRNPFNGNFSILLAFPYSLYSSQSRILPSAPKDRRL